MKCIHYRGGYKYQLRAAYACVLPELADATRAPIVTDWIELDPDGTLRLRPGYACDGASGPTYDSKSSMRGAFTHDAGYQLIRMGLLPMSLRPAIDRAFRRICKEDGMWSARAALWYHAVRIFASPAADPARERADLHAPTDRCL
ncbi:MAG: hypothetical protein HYZ17_16470 [Betaproteobacteria bacterium]|nr:hypothetical protein [Betaproteobacteria bacterium]